MARPIILGGGVAGLAAAWEFARRGMRPLVLEREPDVGGLARTAQFEGYRFDLGGHRFYTKWAEVDAFWRETLGSEFIRRPRLSRIHFGGQFFPYPLKVAETLRGLGAVESVRVALSLLAARLRPAREERTFEDWASQRFGDRLYRTFFKSYTEKVWGIPCTELTAEWASQRLRGVSIRSILMPAFLGSGPPRSLIEEFHYPRLGPGQMWQAVRDRIKASGGETLTGATVTGVACEGGRARRVAYRRGGLEQTEDASHVVSTLSLQELIPLLGDSCPLEAQAAARSLRYRAFVTVCVIVRGADLFPDNWIYIHDPGVDVGRIQNFKNWSPDLVPDPSMTSLGLEYFCNEGDALWSRSDEALVAQATQELERLKLAPSGSVVGGAVVRVPKAYPVYDDVSGSYVNQIRTDLAKLKNLATCGRNGMHRYNNQDHSVMTAFAAVRRLLGEAAADPWTIGHDGAYLEEGENSEGGAEAA